MSRRRPLEHQTPIDTAAYRMTASEYAAATDAAAAGARQRAAAASADAPPVLKGGESPVRVTRRLVSDGRNAVLHETCEGRNEAAFVDWVSFSFHESSLRSFLPGSGDFPTEGDYARAASLLADELFGFGITEQCEKGRNFYRHAYVLGAKAGFVCHGGQRDTVLFMLSGSGLQLAADGWERRVHDFLSADGGYGVKRGAVNGRLTRVDVARDWFEGEYGVDRAASDYDGGMYNNGGRNPDCEQRGNWRAPTGAGRTFYVGNRKSGKFARIYEKGKQLGDPQSSWTRTEVEYKSQDRVIPFEILLMPGAYLAGAYEAFAHFEGSACKVETRKREAQGTVKRARDWINRQCGAALHALVELEVGETLRDRAEKLVLRLADFTRLPAWVPEVDPNGGVAPLHTRAVDRELQATRDLLAYC